MESNVRSHFAINLKICLFKTQCLVIDLESYTGALAHSPYQALQYPTAFMAL